MSARCAFLLAVFLLSACVATPERVARYCASENFHVDAHFEGGNFAQCSFSSIDAVVVAIRPENEPPINVSPWYAFRVSARSGGDISIRLDFVDGYARYWPKLSTDGHTWQPVRADAVQTSDDGVSFAVQLSADEPMLWIAGQELITTSYYDDWIQTLEKKDHVSTSLLGRSVLGRPIFVTKSDGGSEVVILIGRQHPPEITGAFAMRPFVDTVLGDTPLATEFRERYSLLIMPLLNPDGVALGHWRHNVNGVDLNRDWGPFTQPETQSVEKLLAELDQRGLQPRLMLDFHSTKSNLFYTQLPENNTNPPHFATNWLNRSRERLPGFEFKHDARAPSDQANTKNYFFKRYGIPAITYELGDETDRHQIASVTPVFAEEMMRLMLEAERLEDPAITR